MSSSLWRRLWIRFQKSLIRTPVVGTTWNGLCIPVILYGYAIPVFLLRSAYLYMCLSLSFTPTAVFFFDLFFVLFCFNFYTWNLKHLFDKWIKSFTLLGNDPFTKDNENKVP